GEIEKNAPADANGRPVAGNGKEPRGDPRIFGSHLRRSRPFPPAQNLSLGLRYLLLTHSWLKCHTADATASGVASPVTTPSYAQWLPFHTSCTCYRRTLARRSYP